MVVALVLVSTALIVGIWIMSSVQNAVTLPTRTIVESLTLVNDTAKAVSYPYINSLTGISNATLTFPRNDAQTLCSMTSTTVTCWFNASYVAGAYNVEYVYNAQGGNDTLDDVFDTTWSSFQLGVVVLIVLAAVSIIGILIGGFGKAGGPA